ncbi:RHS repeat-associated core domain-containing protein [Silanimonas sp.]|uniref:RHS repeat-associated core domain-containing protein n=1 Tax=Silanimonas sp. TaxID=1929290 RepID=UPI0037CBE08E
MILSSFIPKAVDSGTDAGGVMFGWFSRLRLAALLLALLVPSLVLSSVRLPNGEWRLSNTDLRVSTPRGVIAVERTWQSDDLNKSAYSWHPNPAWSDLTFELDDIDGSVKRIERSGSRYERSGDAYVFERRFLIRKTATGWRWADPQGNWIDYTAEGQITAYGDLGGVIARFDRSEGRITAVRGADNAVALTYTYTGGQVTAITAADGRSVAYRWSGTQLIEVTDASGAVWKYGYRSGLMTSMTDPTEATTTLTYVGPRVATLTDPEGGVQRWTYDYDRVKRQFVNVHRSAAGVERERVYSIGGTLLRETVGSRTVYRLVRDGTNVEIAFDERGQRTRTVFDSNRNPLEVTHPDGTTVTTAYHPVLNRPVQVTDESGTITTMRYDAAGRLLERVDAVGTPVARTTTYTYDAQGRLTSKTQGGATTTWTYTSRGQVETQTDPEGGITRFTYDANGFLQRRTDPLNRTTNYTHDELGRLESITDALGQTTRYGYDALGRRTGVTDAAGRTTTTRYNGNGWVTAITGPDGGVQAMTYTPDGQVATQTDAEGAASTLAYDADGRLESQTDAAGNVTRYVYGDSATATEGLLVAVQYPTFTERYRFDARDRRIQTTREYEGRTETEVTGFDAVGRVISQTDAAGRSTLNAYDALGRLTSTTDALGGITAYGYDARDNLLSVTDANGGTHRFGYDLADRVLTEARPGGETITYAYNAAGELITRTAPGGERRSYGYDNAGRRTTETQRRAGATEDEQSITYRFDPSGELTGYTQEGRTNSAAIYTLDEAGRRASEAITYGNGQNAITLTVGHRWRKNGQREALVYPDGTTVSYAFDPANRLSRITTPAGTYTYADYRWSRPQAITMPGTTREQRFDGLLRPTRLKSSATGQGDTLRMDYGYTYGPTGDITEKTSEDGTTSYGYDALGRLTNVQPSAALQSAGLPVEQYQYDPVHNRTASLHQPGTWRYDANHSLLERGAGSSRWSYQTNANGLRTEQQGPAGNLVYRYSAAERLIGLERNGQTIALYGHDPFNRRIVKNANGALTWFVYSDEGLIAEIDAQGNTTRTYGWQPNGLWGTDPVFLANVSTQANASLWAIHSYHNDHLGTPQRLTDAQGRLTWKAISESFGFADVFTGSRGGVQGADATIAIVNPLRFPGQYYDPEVGTHYNYHRDYEPQTGRYVQTDPIGLGGGVNLSLYSYSSPTVFVDPRGNVVMCFVPVVGQIGCGAVIVGLGAAALICYASGACQAASQAGADALNDAMNDSRDSTATDVSIRPPGDCTREQHRYLQNQVDIACQYSGQRRCYSSDSCEENQRKISANSACAEARRNINSRCFRGGDPGHQEAEEIAVNALNNCINLRSKCCGLSSGVW